MSLLIGIPGMLIGSVLVAWVLVTNSGTGSVEAGALPGAPRDIAQLLFHQFLLPFEVTSVLVLIAIMGAVVLAAAPKLCSRRRGTTDGSSFLLPDLQRNSVCLRRDWISDQAQYHHDFYVYRADAEWSESYRSWHSPRSGISLADRFSFSL